MLGRFELYFLLLLRESYGHLSIRFAEQNTMGIHTSDRQYINRRTAIRDSQLEVYVVLDNSCNLTHIIQQFFARLAMAPKLAGFDLMTVKGQMQSSTNRQQYQTR